MQTAIHKRSILDTALILLHGYAIAKGVRVPASSRRRISPEFLLAFLTGYALGKGLNILALDENEWRTSKSGKHYQIDTETGEITKGNIGQTAGPAVERQKAIQNKITSIHIEAGKNNVLPNLNEETLQQMGKADKPVLLKKNIIEKNLSHHPDVLLDEYATIIGTSLYKHDTIIPGHSDKPYFNFITRIRDDKNTIVLLEMAENKDNYEIVNLHWISDEGRKRKERR